MCFAASNCLVKGVCVAVRVMGLGPGHSCPRVDRH